MCWRLQIQNYLSGLIKDLYTTEGKDIDRGSASATLRSYSYDDLSAQGYWLTDSSKIRTKPTAQRRKVVLHTHTRHPSDASI